MKLAELVPGHVYRVKSYNIEKYAVFVGTKRSERRGRYAGPPTTTSYGLIQRLAIRDTLSEPEPPADDDDAWEAWYKAEHERTVSRVRMTSELGAPGSIRPQEILYHYADSVEAAVARYEQERVAEEEQEAEREAKRKQAQQIVDKLREYVGGVFHTTHHHRVVLTLTIEEAETLYQQLHKEG